MSKKSCPILYDEHTMNSGQDFLDTQYTDSAMLWIYTFPHGGPGYDDTPRTLHENPVPLRTLVA